MHCENVIFDLDGTLTQSEEGIFKSIEFTLSCMNRKIPSRCELRRFIGPPLYTSFRDLLGMSALEAEEAQRIYRSRYQREGWRENCVYSGIPRLLRTLKRNGMRAYVATGKPQESSEQICKYFGITPYLSGIIGPDDGEHSPDKAVMLSEILHVSGKNSVMIGDRKFDVEAAIQNGIPCIGVTYGYGSIEELKNAGATILADSPRELQRILLGNGETERGLFLTLEGMDGCGKTTQRERIVEFLKQRGWEVTVTREPGGDPIAEKIRRIILDPKNTDMCDETEAYLYAASRAQNVRRTILPALKDGEAVVCDRFVDSSIAYQGGGRQLKPDRIEALNQMATGGLVPDITVFLELSPEASLARRLSASNPDRLESEQEAFFHRVHDTYLRYLESNPRVLRIDASKGIDEVTDNLIELLSERIDTVFVNSVV